MAEASTSRRPVGVVGLGLMGSALAERLLAADYPVVVYNRTRSKADPLLARGAQWSDNPLVVCDRIVISLYTTDIVEQMLLQLESGLRSGQILLDTTTGDPRQTAALGQRLAKRGVHYLDAPFSGSSAQTRRGEATAIVAGGQQALDACRDLLDCLAAKTFYVGPWGNASKMKLVTNLVLGLNRAALAEGLAFAKAVGLTMEKALEVMMESPAYSRTMDAKGPKMVQRDFTPQAKLSQHLKDLRLILQEGAGGCCLHLTAVHCKLLEQLEAAGLGELDNSVIIQAFERPAVAQIQR
jgi:3-hydroxyisobutyrate dehydrogenase-like beta-hydroxyacid dehydrogenase